MAAVSQAVLPLLNSFARVPVCGLIAQYSATGQPAEPNLLPATMREVLSKSLTLRGLINYEFAAEHYAAFLSRRSKLLKASLFGVESSSVGQGDDGSPRICPWQFRPRPSPERGC